MRIHSSYIVALAVAHRIALLLVGAVSCNRYAFQANA